MTTLRVTEGSASYDALVGLQSAAARLSSLQAKMSSGQQINKPSDDPAGTVRALQLRADLRRNTQYTSNAGDAQAWLSTSDDAFNQVMKLVQQARTLVVQGLNTGVNSTQAASSIADQIDAIRTSLISVANATYNGRPVFGGTTTGAVAYDSAGNFVGDTNAVTRTVGPNATIQINQTGPQVFGAAGSDVFTMLSNISTTLRTNPSALSAALAQVDGAISTISDAQAVEGAAMQRVQVAQNSQSKTGVALQSELSDIQDIDLADMAIKVTTANTNYQAALQTTANIRQLSLLNFLH